MMGAGTTEPSEEIVIARRRLFSSAHFYRQNRFTPEENKRVFGLCYTPYGHGHNYVVEVFITGPIDPKTRLVMNLANLDRILKTATDPLEHHHINFDVPEFKDLVPTTENIALYLRERITTELLAFDPTQNIKLQRLRLFETDDLWVEIWE